MNDLLLEKILEILQIMQRDSGGMSSTSVTETNSGDILSAAQATQSNTAGMGVLLDNILTQILTKITNNVSPTIARSTSTGSTSINLVSISISNVGFANGTVLGEVLKPGETISYDGMSGSFLINAVTWNAAGTEFLITTLNRI